MSAPTLDPRTPAHDARSGRRRARTNRPLVASLTLVVGCLALAVAALTFGDYPLSASEVVRALTGGGDPLASYFVTELRAPRVVAALTVGAALGVAGALFQGVTGNPLGSPDILGFTTGAATGALVQIIVFSSSTTAVALGALIGGLGTAALVHVLTRSTGLTGSRLVLVGIGVGALLSAVNTLLVVRASLVAAQTAGQWLAGSLNAMMWERAGLTLAATAVLVAVALLLQRDWALLSLGDDITRSLGVDAARVRGASVLVAVCLVSVATAATGPIGFVALAAPQIARRLAGTAIPPIAASALTGAALVLASDIVAQRLLAPTQLAVGVVTGAVGGVYLIALLAGQWKRFRP